MSSNYSASRILAASVMVPVCAAIIGIGLAPQAVRAQGYGEGGYGGIRVIRPASSPAKPSKETTLADGPLASTSRKIVLKPKELLLHLMDGTVISGELSVNRIEVFTEFGTLVVPVEKILSITPGLDSHPALAARIQELIDDLGEKEGSRVEAAKRDLIAMGPKVRDLLAEADDGGNAQRRTNLEEVVRRLTEQIAEQAFGDPSKIETWKPYDTVVTRKFTIAGKVAPQSFTVTSRYGPLTVGLADLQLASREIGGSQTIRKTVTVTGNDLVQRSFKNAGITVQRGDRISVTANGQIIMTPYGSNAIMGPDGAPNYGSYQGNIYSGTLVARIGTSGELIRVGSQHTFVAKKSGVLHFAIGMNNSYSQRGYSYPGQYNVKVKVEREN